MFILSVDSKKKKKNTKPQEYLWCISHRKLYPQPQQPASFGVGGTANISVIFQCPLIHLQSDALRSCGQSHPGRTHPVMKESGNGRAISIPSGHIILIFHFTKGDAEDLRSLIPYHSPVEIQYCSQAKLRKATLAHQPSLSHPQALAPAVPSPCKPRGAQSPPSLMLPIW